MAQLCSNKIPKSINLSGKERVWRTLLTYHHRLQLAFVLAARTAWDIAKEQDSQLKLLHDSYLDLPDDISMMTQYLRGSIAQGTGDLHSAFHHLSALTRDAGSSESTSSYSTSSLNQAPGNPSQLRQDLHILSTLNMLLMIRSPSHPQHAQCHSLLTSIATPALSNTNKSITCAYHILSAVLPSTNPSTILATKSSLQSALQSARTTVNNQLMCIVLNIMSWKFFQGVVTEQALKSARASLSMARKCADGLWGVVASAHLAKSLESSGRFDEAQVVLKSGRDMARVLPEEIKKWLFWADEQKPQMQ